MPVGNTVDRYFRAMNAGCWRPVLFLHPELVNPAYKAAPPVTGKNLDDLYNLAVREGWPGYLGAPHRTSASLAWGPAATEAQG